MNLRLTPWALATALTALLLLNGSLLPATEPAKSAEWPEFHGPNRDNISTEKGLLKKWPEGGPRLVWKYSPCGVGYAGVAIADGMIFTSGDFGEEEIVFALDMDGKPVWKSPNGASWQQATPGSRTTPTYHQGMLYHMNPTGRLAALDAKTGKPRWTVDLQGEFGARFGTWALAENVVVEGDRVLCLPGGSKGFAVALDKNTGKTIWANTEFKERAAYCSPVLATHQGTRLLVTLAERSVVGIDVKTGKLLWSHPFGKVWQNTTSPVVHDGQVFITCGHSSGGQLLKINPDGRGLSEVWYRKDFDNCHGGVILLDGTLYGCGCRLGGKAFFAIDFLTGKTKYTNKTLGKISITYADGMLYCVSNTGQMLLLAITPEGCNLVSQFNLPRESKDESLCHPVVCGGRLYMRHDQNLYVYDVRTK